MGFDRCTEHRKNNGYSFHCDYIGKWSDITENEFNQKVKIKNLDKYIQAHGAKYGEEKILFLSKQTYSYFPLITIMNASH